MSSTTPRSHRARKKHVCSICGSHIHLNTAYDAWRWFDDGADDAVTVKVHPDCRAFFDEVGIDRWTVGDTFADHLSGWMTRDEAREALAAFADANLRAFWLAWLDEIEREEADHE